MRNRWSNAEENSVTDEAVRLLRHDPTTDIQTALRKAQALLKPDRRKAKFTQFYKVQLIQRVKAKLDKQVSAKTAPEFPRTLPQPEKKSPERIKSEAKAEFERDRLAAIEARRRDEDARRAEAEAKPQLNPKSEIQEAIESIMDGFNILAIKFGEVFGAQMANTLSDRIAELRPVAPAPVAAAVKVNGNGNGAHHEEPAPRVEISERIAARHGNLDARFHKPKVCIAHLLAQQCHEIKRRMPNVEFRFIAHSIPAAQAHDIAENCDVVVAMTKFITHPMESSLRNGAKKGGGDFIRVHGGISLLERELTEKLKPATAAH